MLTKSEIVTAINEETGINKPLIKRVLDDLAELAATEVDQGNDFVVPGICKLSYNYRAPQAKGARWKKGETVVGFGGVESVKDAPSPPVTARIVLKAAPTGGVARLKPKTSPEFQSEFVKSSVGKSIAKRKKR